MTNELMLMIGMCIMAGIGVWGGMSFRSDDYRRGQIDALNGRIKYQKEENEDGEIIWTEIKRKVK